MDSNGKSRLIIIWMLAFAGGSVQGDWRMWGADESRSFRSDGLGPENPPVLLWEYRTDDNYTFWTPSFVVGPENESYVIENVVGIVALDANGKERWRKPRDPGGGLALSKTGVLYCASGYTQSAWTTDGNQLWSYDMACVQHPPAVDGDGIMYASWAVRDSTGQRIGVSGPAIGPLALPPGAGLPGPIYQVSCWNWCDHLIAFQLTEHPDHNLYWDTLWSNLGMFFSTHIRPDGTILTWGMGGYLYAHDPNGSRLWYEGVYYRGPAIDRHGTIRLTAGASLVCLDNDGNQVWALPLLKAGQELVDIGELAVDAAGTTYLTKSWSEAPYKGGSAITAVDAGGKVVWERVNTGGENWGAGDVILGEKGRLYVVNNGRIWAFGPACPRPGDFNCDGNVDFLDYAVLASHWLDAECSGPAWCYATDFDKNTKVDSDDLKKFTDRWLNSSEGD